MNKKLTGMLVGMVVICIITVSIISHHIRIEKKSDVAEEIVTQQVVESETETETQADATESAEETESAAPIKEISMKEALLIGDSRMVGIKEYGSIDEADFFCYTGAGVRSIRKETVTVDSVGSVTLDQLLAKKQYSYIYIMLGINEIGYNLDRLTENYRTLLDFIQEVQPQAKIFIHSNLHVSKSRSDGDDVINNENLNYFNHKISEFADGETIYYMDINTVFDDANGGLSEKKTGDSIHPYASAYNEWSEWIVSETKKLLQ